jgi:membrane protein implicated in regulation of membrane protease activity
MAGSYPRPGRGARPDFFRPPDGTRAGAGVSCVAVGVIYLGALIVGLGTILLQLFMSGDGDADAGGHDVAVDADADVDADVDADAAGHDFDAQGHGGHGGHDIAGGFLPIFLSLRFWTFGFMAFGIVGTLLAYLGLAAPLLTALLATAMGVGSGFFASWSFRALARSATQSGAQSGDAVGQVGKVLVRCTRQGRGKVRVELRGQTVDYLATTEAEELAEGELVLVEEVRDGEVRVARAPAEFLPNPSDER